MLQGVKVLQLANLLPGPLACKMLQSLGAQVTTVEPKSHGGGDPIKHFRFTPDTHTGLKMYDALNCRKYATHYLDLARDEAGGDTFRNLCRDSDVLVYSLKPNQFAKQRLTPFDLREEFPDLIIASITGYGLPQRGELQKDFSSRAGHDINYLARSGVLGVGNQKTTKKTTSALTDYQDPILQPQVVQVADIAGGAYPAVTQILAALFQKERRQRLRMTTTTTSETKHNDNLGALIDISMTDCARSLSLLSETIRKDLQDHATKLQKETPDAEHHLHLLNNYVEGGNFILSGAAPCYRFYPTKDDRLIAVGCLEHPYWIKFLKLLDDKTSTATPSSPSKNSSLAERFSSPFAQFAKSQEFCGKTKLAAVTAEDVIQAITERTMTKTHREWWELLDSEDCMVDPVLTGEEALTSDHFQRRQCDDDDRLWSEFHVNSPFRFL